jgi:hypothetical protein
MDSFYLIVLSIATIVLILLLTFIGILMKKAVGAEIYPTVSNMCPDYWDASSTPGVCYVPNGSTQKVNRGGLAYGTPTYNVKDYTNNKLGYKDGTSETSPATFNMLDTAAWGKEYPGYTLKCAQRKWAIDNQISWDGVTNYNGCS